MELPTYLEPRASELLAQEFQVHCRRSYWAVILGLVPYKDGDQWCILWGKNIQEGVTGFGNTPIEAMEDFEKSMYKGRNLNHGP